MPPRLEGAGGKMGEQREKEKGHRWDGGIVQPNSTEREA